jgi:hypothetical protein
VLSTERPDQVANYTIDGRLLISSFLWNHPLFTAVDKAALVVHEVVYKHARKNHGNTTSDRARETVGILFSDLSIQALRTKLTGILRLEWWPENVEYLDPGVWPSFSVLRLEKYSKFRGVVPIPNIDGGYAVLTELNEIIGFSEQDRNMASRC